MRAWYESGGYVTRNPTLHAEESSWKATWVARMMIRHRLAARTIGEVGCGAGGVLAALQQAMPDVCEFWGYDISPQAVAMASRVGNRRLHFVCGDLDRTFDLLLMLDVVEHQEDPFSFLRSLRDRADRHLFHFPLDLSVQTVLRRRGLTHLRDVYAHLNFFNRDLVLRLLQDTGYRVVDCCYTPRATEQPTWDLRRRLLKLPRRLAYALNADFAVRLLGGWSLLVLAERAPASP